jgi:RND superfamily putative drug exporter
MSDRTWWLPRWLDRALPEISIEGGPQPAPESSPA